MFRMVMALTTIVGAALSRIDLRAADSAPPATRVAQSFNQHVIGKTLIFEKTSTIGAGEVSADFSWRVTFTDFAEYGNGFRFDEVGGIRQTNAEAQK